jgi:hypothetical protein
MCLARRDGNANNVERVNDHWGAMMSGRDFLRFIPEKQGWRKS